MELVELIRGIATDDVTFDTARAFVAKLGKQVAVSEDFPAFIVNRILLPMINEAIYTLYEGVGNVEAIDAAMKLGAHHPMGPLELADFIGLDTCLSIMQVLHEGSPIPKYRPCPLLVKYVEAGWLGRKSAARLRRLSRRQAGPDAVIAGSHLQFGARNSSSVAGTRPTIIVTAVPSPSRCAVSASRWLCACGVIAALAGTLQSLSGFLDGRRRVREADADIGRQPKILAGEHHHVRRVRADRRRNHDRSRSPGRRARACRSRRRS